MPLTSNIAARRRLKEYNVFPLAAGVKVFQGGALGLNTNGFARPLQAGDRFVGIAEADYDNTDGANGDIFARVLNEAAYEFPITGLTGHNDWGKPVYAVDDNTFTLNRTSAIAGGGTLVHSYVGTVYQFVSTGVGVFHYDILKGGKAGIVPLTDNSGGTASTTLAAITDVPTRNAVASIAAQLNALADQG